MVLWELTLATAYWLGLRKTYRLALKLQRRLVGPRHPRLRDFLQRRTRNVFDVALTAHKEIQKRDLSAGRSLGNFILRFLDRMRPSAHIRGSSNANHSAERGKLSPGCGGADFKGSALKDASETNNPTSVRGSRSVHEKLSVSQNVPGYHMGQAIMSRSTVGGIRPVIGRLTPCLTTSLAVSWRYGGQPVWGKQDASFPRARPGVLVLPALVQEHWKPSFTWKRCLP